jgi:Fur family ferric uptake transcriptional regulator
LKQSILKQSVLKQSTLKRSTKQRSAICRVFSECARPLSHEEVLQAAKLVVPQLGIATVYRAIHALLAEGWLTAVEIPGGAPRYEIAGKNHHHHFHCRNCNSVYEIEGCPGNFSKLTPPGFQLENHEVILYGRCSSCRHQAQ